MKPTLLLYVCVAMTATCLESSAWAAPPGAPAAAAAPKPSAGSLMTRRDMKQIQSAATRSFVSSPVSHSVAPSPKSVTVSVELAHPPTPGAVPKVAATAHVALPNGGTRAVARADFQVAKTVNAKTGATSWKLDAVGADAWRRIFTLPPAGAPQ